MEFNFGFEDALLTLVALDQWKIALVTVENVRLSICWIDLATRDLRKKFKMKFQRTSNGKWQKMMSSGHLNQSKKDIACKSMSQTGSQTSNFQGNLYIKDEKEKDKITMVLGLTDSHYGPSPSQSPAAHYTEVNLVLTLLHGNERTSWSRTSMSCTSWELKVEWESHYWYQA